MVFRPHSEWVATKKCEIKCEINTITCRLQIAADPAKRGLERARIERETPDCRLGRKRASSSPAWIDGIDRAFLFGNARHPVLALGCTPSTTRSGATQVSWDLPQVGTNYSTIYLGSDTKMVSPGASPVTLTPGGGGVEICLLHALQVITCLQTLYICFTDIPEVERAHPGPFCAISDPPRWGDQNRKNRDFTRTRFAIVSRVEALILVHICMGFALFPRCRFSRFHPGRCGRIMVKFPNCDPTQ